MAGKVRVRSAKVGLVMPRGVVRVCVDWIWRFPQVDERTQSSVVDFFLGGGATNKKKELAEARRIRNHLRLHTRL